MSIALDVGNTEIRSLQLVPDGLVGRRWQMSYFVVPDQPSHRLTLTRMNLQFSECDGSLVVLGPAAADFCHLFQVPARRLLPDGRIPAQDPPARQLLAAVLDKLLPKPTGEETPVCSLVMPDHPDEEVRRESYRWIAQVARLKGYRPLEVDAGTAAILAADSQQNFTGLGLNFGAGSIRGSVVFQGRPLADCTIRLAGDWLDFHLASRSEAVVCDSRGQRYLDLTAIRRWKESPEASLSAPGTPRAEILHGLYRQLLEQMFQRLANHFARQPQLSLIQRPVRLVYAGGPTRIEGFHADLERACRRTPFPLEIDQLISIDAPYATARGGLVQAELEARLLKNQPQAA